MPRRYEETQSARAAFFHVLGRVYLTRQVFGMLGDSDTLMHSSGGASGIVEGRGFVMAEDNRINGFAWFLAGLGVGALVGILYAPKSGRETRDDLASGAREGAEYLRNRSKEVAEQVGTLVDRGKEQAGEYIDRGREVVDRGRAQWEDFVERGKSLVGEQGTKVAAAVEAGRQAYKSGSSSNVTAGSTAGVSTENSTPAATPATNPY